MTHHQSEAWRTRRHGRALHRVLKKHRAKLRDLRDQALNRMHRHRSSCERKIRYSSRAQAERHRDSRTIICGAYQCRFCQGWHLSKEGAA